MYALEKPVPRWRDRVPDALVAIVACAAIMIVSALFIMEASK
jgi:hypothetical protein